MPHDKKHSSDRSMILFYLATFALVIICIEYFGTIKSDFMLFERVHPLWLLAALVAQIGTYYLSARAYQVLLLAYVNDKVFSLSELFQISIAMLFFNSAIPSIGLSGNTFFSKLLIKRGISAQRSLAFILFELFIVYLSRIIIIFLIFAAGFFFDFPDSFYTIFMTGIIAYMLLGLIMVISERKKVFSYVIDKFKRIDFIRERLEKYEAVFEPKNDYNENLLKIFASKKGLTFRAIGYNIGINVCDMFTIYAIFLGSGVSINPMTVVIVYVLTQIITLLPTSPGSLLVYEGSMTFLFMRMGVPFGASITAVLLYRCLSFWLPIPIGFFLQKRLQKKN